MRKFAHLLCLPVFEICQLRRDHWLRNLGLERSEATFRENAINEKVLPNVTSTRSWSAKSLNCSAARRRMRSSRIWRKAWWALHYGGRGGPTVLAISAFDMALWDLKAKRARLAA